MSLLQSLCFFYIRIKLIVILKFPARNKHVNYVIAFNGQMFSMRTAAFSSPLNSIAALFSFLFSDVHLCIGIVHRPANSVGRASDCQAEGTAAGAIRGLPLTADDYETAKTS